MTRHESAYDKHWKRLAELLGPDEAKAERERMTADERADRRRKKIADFEEQLPRLREYLAKARRDQKDEYTQRLQKQIAYRERVIAEAEEEEL